MKKGSYFFVIDAFIAGLIILSAVVVLFGSFLQSPSNVQAFYTAEDLLTLYDSTKVREFDSPILRTWTTNGTINSTERTLLEQLAYFNATGRNVQAQELSVVLLTGVPENIGAEIFIEGVSYGGDLTVPKESADVFFSSKRIILLRQGPKDLFPPVIVEVQTWQ